MRLVQHVWTHPYRMIVTLVIVLVVSLGSAGYAVFVVFNQQAVVDKKICDATVANRMSARATWQAVRSVFLLQIANDPTTTKAEKGAAAAATNVFINTVLGPIPPLVCKDGKPKEEA